MPQARWRVFLCGCDGALSLEPQEVGRLAGLSTPPQVVPALPGAGLEALKSQVKGQPFDFILIGCCAPREALEAALSSAGVDPAQIVCLDLKTRAYGPRPGSKEGDRVAGRLIRAAMAATEGERKAPSLTLQAGPSILIDTDDPSGLRLAERLADKVEATLILEESSALHPEQAPARPWALIHGRTTEVRGHLGNFQVTVERLRPVPKERGDPKTRPGLGHERLAVPASQVVLIRTQGDFPEGGRHTGYHRLTPSQASPTEDVATRVLDLVGVFTRPTYVQYDPDICAAGSAEFQGCGICIPHCPYDAITREGRRVKVSDLTCEGCAACVSVCPTSALRFLEPSEAQIDAQLRAYLLPPAGEAMGPLHPAIVFHCGERGTAALRAAGDHQWPYGENLLPVEVPCLRFVSEAWILRAFRLGAAGVALLGCAECPHGERPRLGQTIDFVRAALEAFGFGAERLALITADGESAPAIESLAAFGAALGPPPLPAPAPFRGGLSNRELLKDALLAFMDGTGREPGRVVEGTPLSFAEVRVRAEGCTLCGACVFVCPSHALLMEEAGPEVGGAKTLKFDHLACVACGMCEPACPEKVITLYRDLTVTRKALAHQPLVRDEMVRCAKCGREYINQRALESIIARVLAMPQLGDTFTGARRDLLRMCPDCRAAVAIQEMQKGWEP